MFIVFSGEVTSYFSLHILWSKDVSEIFSEEITVSNIFTSWLLPNLNRFMSHLISALCWQSVTFNINIGN